MKIVRYWMSGFKPRRLRKPNTNTPTANPNATGANGLNTQDDRTTTAASDHKGFAEKGTGNSRTPDDNGIDPFRLKRDEAGASRTHKGKCQRANDHVMQVVALEDIPELHFTRQDFRPE